MKTWLERMRADFKLSIITVSGIFVAVVIMPFAIFRLVQGSLIIFFMDMGIFCVSCIIVIYAWWSQRTDIAALFLAATISFGVAFASQLNTVLTPYWMYCVVLANFALVPPKHAMLLVSICLSAVLFSHNSFSDHTTRMTYAITTFATILFAYIFSVQNEQQRQALTTLARTDPLTGIGNRRAFEEEADTALRANQRQIKPATALAMIDIDHFKRINDRYGHEGGDEALVNIVQLIANHTRPKDRFFRMGGEEFCLLMENTDKQGAIQASEKICSLVRESTILNNQIVTISIGVSQSNELDDIETWLRRCDNALYSAKRKGRDRVIYFEQPDEQS